MTSSPSPCAARLLADACTAAVLAGCANVTEGQRNIMTFDLLVNQLAKLPDVIEIK